jgi:predicted HTH transcriptional regulator
VAKDGLSPDQVLELLAYPSYFSLLGLPLPRRPEQILEALAVDGLVQTDDAARFQITNLGALLFANDLSAFPTLKRKAMRVIQYSATSRITTLKEQTANKGYATGFEGLIGYINGLLPSNEVIGVALRRTVPMFPELAVREVVANALIHQDFSITGAGPMVEIFEGRVEITNPGAPIVNTSRFLDSPPRSRNEALASLMRRIGVCEERGSGVDKIVFQTEFYQLPAPLFEAPEEATKVTLFAHQPVTEMSRDDRVRACYLHACLRYVQRQDMTNATVRERFGIDKKNAAAASRYIREAVAAELIAPMNTGAAKKQMKYVPFWAAISPKLI